MEDGKEKGRKKYIKFPCYVQPKLDGVRCLADVDDDDMNRYLSRGGKEFDTLDHLNKEVAEIYPHDTMNNVHLDGEIYCHNEITFQKIVAAVKKKSEDSPKLKYYIYDLATTGMSFEERKAKLEEIFKDQELEHLVLVPSYEVKSEAEIVKYHEQFVEQGYEGVIIRNKEGEYGFDERSNDLQKWKFFHDKEFKIVGGKEATGNDKGTVVFICDVGDGRTFEVRPRGSRELRRKWWENLESLKGQRLTVRYQSLSDDGIPTKLTGIGIRDYE
jgi:DNA ligase-1